MAQLLRNMRRSLVHVAKGTQKCSAGIVGPSPRSRTRPLSSAPAKPALLNEFRKKLGSGPSLHDFITGESTKKEAVKRPLAPRPAPIVPNVAKSASADPVPQEDVKSVLRDKFGRFHNYLRISITERCNLRCVYCMPADGIQLQSSDRLLSSEEIIRVAETFVELGVDKIRLTGGEPLVRKDLVELARSLRGLGLKELAITTNGVAPRSKLIDLVDAGVTHFNVSLDTLLPDRFAAISRRPAKMLSTVLGTIDQLFESGLSGRVKLNCVVMRGVNDDELESFAALSKDRPLDVRFIEWMPFDSNGWNGTKFVSYVEMIERLQAAYPDFERQVDGKNDTTKWYSVPGYSGRVGFITSMSQHFCGSCNRLRITADGKLKVCLFGAEDLSLRDALRGGLSKEELRALIGGAVTQKKFSLGGQEDMYSLAKSKNRPMILIGG